MHEYSQALGCRLKRWRIEAGLKVREVNALLQYGGSIHLWENGDRPIPAVRREAVEALIAQPYKPKDTKGA